MAVPGGHDAQHCATLLGGSEAASARACMLKCLQSALVEAGAVDVRSVGRSAVFTVIVFIPGESEDDPSSP